MNIDPAKRKAILVLGMHRSGTSAVSGVLSRLGATLPSDLMPATNRNERGHFESLAFRLFHDEFLSYAGSRWDDWRPIDLGSWTDGHTKAASDLFRELFGASPLALLKDPRMCRLVPAWQKVMQDLNVVPAAILVVRSPLEVAKSLERRDRLPVTYGILLWLRHVLDAERDTRMLPRAVVDWPGFMVDSDARIEQISRDIGIVWPRWNSDARKEIADFLSRDLNHFEFSRAQLATRGDVHSWAVVAYDAMRDLAQQRDSARAHAVLDELRSSFEQAITALGPAFDYELETLEKRSGTELYRLRLALARSRGLSHRACGSCGGGGAGKGRVATAPEAGAAGSEAVGEDAPATAGCPSGAVNWPRRKALWLADRLASRWRMVGAKQKPGS